MEAELIFNLILFFGLIYIIAKSASKTPTKTKEDTYYDDIKKGDSEFYDELDAIYKLITKDKCEDLKLIAQDAKVSLTECIVKIRYLIKIGKLKDEYYIDHNNAIIKQCNKEEQELLKKYSNYIYQKKYQIKEIAKDLHGHNIKGHSTEELLDITYNDIKYLIDKKLVNRVSLDEETRTIIYPKKGNDYISKTCPNCGALNDVRRFQEGKCKYCNSIIKE